MLRVQISGRLSKSGLGFWVGASTPLEGSGTGRISKSGVGFRVLGFRVQGLGFTVEGLGFAASIPFKGSRVLIPKGKNTLWVQHPGLYLWIPLQDLEGFPE